METYSFSTPSSLLKSCIGLETLEPTEAAGRLLNTFQLKGLRKKLKLHTTFVQRNNSNEYVCRRANETLNAPSEGPGRQIKPQTKFWKTENWNFLGMSWEGIGNIHYTKLRSPQDPRSHGKPNTEDEAAHNNSGHLTIWVKHGKWLRRMMLHNRKYHSTRTTDRCERIIEQAQRYQPPFNKGNPIWNIQCENCAQCDTFTQCEPFAQCDTFTLCETFAQCEVFATWEDIVSIIHHQAVSEALGSW